MYVADFPEERLVAPGKLYELRMNRDSFGNSLRFISILPNAGV